VLIDQARIRELIPHSGAMCLLERVVECDAERIRCIAVSHRDPANPLARNGRLAAICGVEYAGQAMALHGALSEQGSRTRGPGYLATVRELDCRCAWLDECGPALTVEARLLVADGPRVIYQFELRDESGMLVCGRAAVALEGASTEKS
jgi:predicted hotdog family 3-hydroxylacyl-ACP dehydratase